LAYFCRKGKETAPNDKVATVFGCWTSASRKAVLPVFEENNGLLWYPVQYEGMESSPNIFYTGAAPNQQIVPAVEWLWKTREKDFSSLAPIMYFQNRKQIIKAQLSAIGGELIAEEYTPWVIPITVPL